MGDACKVLCEAALRPWHAERCHARGSLWASSYFRAASSGSARVTRTCEERDVA